MRVLVHSKAILGTRGRAFSPHADGSPTRGRPDDPAATRRDAAEEQVKMVALLKFWAEYHEKVHLPRSVALRRLEAKRLEAWARLANIVNRRYAIERRIADIEGRRRGAGRRRVGMARRWSARGLHQ